MSEAHRLAERLNKLVILDEVGSNNPLAKDAAALLLRQETLIERQRELLDLALEALEVSFPIVQHERFVQDASYGRNFSQTKTDRARTAHDKAKETITALRAALAVADEASHHHPAPPELEEAINAALAQQDAIPDPVSYNGWVLREVLFDNGEPVGHRAPSNRVMLTGEEIARIYTEQTGARIADSPWALADFARAVVEAYETKNGINRG